MLETDVGAVNLKSLGNNIFRNIYYRKLNAVTPVYWTSMTQGCFIKICPGNAKNPKEYFNNFTFQRILGTSFIGQCGQNDMVQ
jgi:hypothetical protein